MFYFLLFVQFFFPFLFFHFWHLHRKFMQSKNRTHDFFVACFCSRINRGCEEKKSCCLDFAFSCISRIRCQIRTKSLVVPPLAYVVWFVVRIFNKSRFVFFALTAHTQARARISANLFVFRYGIKLKAIIWSNVWQFVCITTNKNPFRYKNVKWICRKLFFLSFILNCYPPLFACRHTFQLMYFFFAHIQKANIYVISIEIFGKQRTHKHKKLDLM